MTGSELRRLRERRGETQREFARRIGRHWNTVARWERDEVPIDEAAARLARLLTDRE